MRCGFERQCACHLGYDADTFYSNIRIVLSTVACVIGLFASVWLPYPESKETLILAIVRSPNELEALNCKRPPSDKCETVK